MNILQVNNLSKHYVDKKETRGIFNLNFEVKKGSFHAFIGENGAGKTTTIKSIIGSYHNYDGEIVINEINAKNPESKAKLGYVPENAIFPKELTTWNYLYSLALLSGINKSQAKEKINNLLDKFEIQNLANSKPYTFSSGQKKKVLLIQALLNNPDLIILDEPAANLDPTARYQLFTLLKELHNEGKSIFISSHVLSEIDKYVDSYTLIHKGKIVDSGIKNKPLEEIFYEKVINQ
ncbi:ABC transporter ATP-binding protein [Mycoplasmopsis verecunda]|uniref:ABC-2 type transport system ATP-binding protein n=1 Tax=Mycoplasmopsis verecunda TaxID=171291 RepID=A0A1T4KFK9_9BACT|nr:ABC transporter ATP-binding protein [Mycoplasmopsis verecunda]WPB54885.1 ABC transporter ATP-binding protein [Mycoplasmopsis verecunda]SJZ41123.1 ABC-2 type transport system ATP-binding protein [Mycoplasmopsis verecunda]